MVDFGETKVINETKDCNISLHPFKIKHHQLIVKELFNTGLLNDINKIIMKYLNKKYAIIYNRYDRSKDHIYEINENNIFEFIERIEYPEDKKKSIAHCKNDCIIMHDCEPLISNKFNSNIIIYSDKEIALSQNKFGKYVLEHHSFNNKKRFIMHDNKKYIITSEKTDKIQPPSTNVIITISDGINDYKKESGKTFVSRDDSYDYQMHVNLWNNYLIVVVDLTLIFFDLKLKDFKEIEYRDILYPFDNQFKISCRRFYICFDSHDLYCTADGGVYKINDIFGKKTFETVEFSDHRECKENETCLMTLVDCNYSI